MQVSEHLKDLITVVVGYPWTDFTVSAMPVTASIRIGDDYSGSGVYRNNSMKPGTYIMTVEAPGYIGEEIEIVLNPKETRNNQDRSALCLQLLLPELHVLDAFLELMDTAQGHHICSKHCH